MKFKITYNEGNVTNQTAIVEADNVNDALVKFQLDHPNAVYENVIEIVLEDA